MPYGWRTPVPLKKGEKVTIENAASQSSYLQTRDNGRNNQEYTLYINLPTKTEIKSGKIVIQQSKQYTNEDKNLKDTDNLIARYLKVIRRIKFGVTNFTEYGDALEHFTLAHDGSRMEPLYDYDLLHAMTHKIQEYLVSTGHTTEANAVLELWSKKISKVILPPDIDRMKSLSISKEFLGWFCLSKGYLKNKKRLKWNQLRGTEIFSEIEERLKTQTPHLPNGRPSPTITEFYTEPSEHVDYFQIATNPIGSIDMDANGEDKFLGYEARTNQHTQEKDQRNLSSIVDGALEGTQG